VTRLAIRSPPAREHSGLPSAARTTVAGVGKATYPYQPYAGDGGSPSLEVTLLGANGREHVTVALVDTGAEWSILPTWLAVELGAELDSEFCRATQTQHAGGLSGAHWWNGAPDGSTRDELLVRFGEFEVPLAPVLKPDITIVAFGRNDFLESFRFSVDQRAQTFCLELYAESLSEWHAKTRAAEPVRDDLPAADQDAGV
jgi:hypothetical protein